MVLAVTCSDYGVVTFVKVLKIIFDMIMILAPALAIISVAFLMFRIVTSSDADKNDALKNRIKNVLISLVVIFFLPLFINLLMSATFMKDTFEVSACWEEADGVIFSKKGKYIPTDSDKQRQNNTYIIDPNQYEGKGTNGNPNENVGNSASNTSSTSDTSDRQGQIKAAVNWAVTIANDNSFSYGKKPYASKMGCYYCGTNGPKAKAAKGHVNPPSGRSWEKTYVCNTFVSAAFAHGAQDPIFLKYDKKGSAALPGDNTKGEALKRLGNHVKDVGKPAYSKLEAGDILGMTHKHTALYIGNGQYVDATSSGDPWGADSISVKNFSKKKYASYDYVLRYQGY